MKVTKATDHSEAEVVGGMAVHPVVLARLAQAWPTDPELPGPLPSVWANLVAGWCVRHQDKHGKPPGKLLGRIARRWAAERKRDEATQELVERFVASLPDATEDDINAGYVLEVAAKLIDKTKAARLMDDLQVCYDTGRLQDFFAAANAAAQANVAASGWVALSDPLALQAAYDDAPKPLFRPKGDLGLFYGRTFARASLVAFMGPEKSGKSRLLIDCAWRLLKAGRRVAVFQCGDLTQAQALHRFGSLAARRPLRSTLVAGRHLPVKVPVAATVLHGEFAPRHKSMTWDHDMTAAEAGAGFAKAGVDFPALSKLVTRPSKSLPTKEVRQLLAGWAREGWAPDAVVIDYADILMTPPGARDVRHGIDEVWQDLSRIRQEFNCSVLTASQTKRGSRLNRWMTPEDISEDKRKLAHVTAAIGINQTADEKDNGVVRLNHIVNRDGEDGKVACAGAAALSAPTMFSSLLEG